MTKQVGSPYFAWDKLSTDIGVYILSFLEDKPTAEVSRAFQLFTRKVLIARWNEPAKDTKLHSIALLQQELFAYDPFLSPSLSQISLCFARLKERQKALCPTYPADFAKVQTEYSSSFSLLRFVEGDAVVSRERDDNLMRLWRVINGRLQRIPKEFGTLKMRQEADRLENAADIRSWMGESENQAALLNRISTLDLSDNELTEIPSEILLLKGLEPEGLLIRNNPLRRIAPELVPYIPLNMPTLCDEGDKRAPLTRLPELEEVPFRLWFRQNCMPGESYQYGVECIAGCVARVAAFLLTIPGAILYFLAITLPVFLLNHFTMYVVEPIAAYARNFFGYPPTVTLK